MGEQCFGTAIKCTEGGIAVRSIGEALNALEVTNAKTVARVKVLAGLAEAPTTSGRSWVAATRFTTWTTVAFVA